MKGQDAKIAHVAALLEQARGLRLLGVGGIECFSAARLAVMYNGAGPDWLPASVRSALTKKLAWAEAAFLIHDVDFHFSDGTAESFAAANDRLEHNCLTLANVTHPMGDSSHLQRAEARTEALIVGEACRRFGWKAWLEAHEKNLPRQGLREKNTNPVSGDSADYSLRDHATGTAGTSSTERKNDNEKTD